ncbi:MAG: peptide-methionine (S)-S-oxide reductase MsrA [Flavobacteriaceae bacterium]|nr:peptide-methionine (S)-S-oxide reductase MsrA [Flavobacteriaceae bacterium]
MEPKKLYLLLALIFAAAFGGTYFLLKKESPEIVKNNVSINLPIQVETQNRLKKAYFASGCFWCVEAIYESVKGVKESISGYSGGHTKNPTYDESNTGKTGHAEAVEIIYDPTIINFKQLVTIYFGSQNVIQVNGQGNDRGSQYRSIIFYQNEEEKKIIETKIGQLNKQLKGKKVAAEVVPFQKFWIAEEYHQNYEKLHPNNSYIQNVSIPRLKKFQKKFPELLREDKH